MSHFFRLVDDGIVDFFVQKAEDFCYCRHKFLKNTPYLLCNGELDCLPGYFPKKTSYCLVVAETPGNRKYVVLQTTQCCGCYLGGEAGALALPEAEIGLAILKHDFKSPASGINLPRLDKLKVGIRGEQSVPFTMLCPAYKKILTDTPPKTASYMM